MGIVEIYQGQMSMKDWLKTHDKEGHVIPEVHDCERHWAIKRQKVEAHSVLEIGQRTIYLCNTCAYAFVEHMKSTGQKMDTKKIKPKSSWRTIDTVLGLDSKKELT